MDFIGMDLHYFRQTANKIGIVLMVKTFQDWNLDGH